MGGTRLLKPLKDARADIEEAAYLFEYYGGWVTKLAGEIPPVGPNALSLVVREPIGVAPYCRGITRS